MSLLGKLWRSARSLVYRPLSNAYERSLRWITLDDLPHVETAILGTGSQFDVPSIDAPFLMHAPREGRNYLTFPPPKTAMLHRPLYSAKFQIVFLSRHRILADTINDRYPFRVGAMNVYGRSVDSVAGYATSFRARWNNYYHLLVDVLPRLELLRHPHFERYEELSLLCPGGLLPLERNLLEKIGLPPRTRILALDEERLYRPEHYVHVSFPTLRFCGAVPEWYRARIQETVVPQRPSRHANRILISRQGASKRRILNFEELEAALQPLGFDVVELEKLDFESQVELFYDAEVVVGTHGAGLTNVLFSDKVGVVELFPQWYVMPHYLYLCQSLGHAYQYCVSEVLPGGTNLETERHAVLEDLLPINDSHFHVDVEAVLERIRRLGVT